MKFNRRIVGLSLLAILLILGCARASIWQFDRYQVRHSNNQLIERNLAKPAIDENGLSGNPTSIAWRTINISGNFIPEKEILVRGRYHQDTYGYGVVTLFRSFSGKSYWVDRGWVRAGADAKTAPVTQSVTSQVTTITARVRIEGLERQVAGALFALPQGNGASTLQRWNQSQSTATESIYFDLVSSTNPTFTPQFPTEVPVLSDGPHLAYSFQWLLFALFVAFGWFLVMREERRELKC